MTSSELSPIGKEAFELSDEQLERIVGGKMTGNDIDEYLELIAIYKKNGWTKEKFIAGYDFLGPEEQREIAGLVEKHWNTL